VEYPLNQQPTIAPVPAPAPDQPRTQAGQRSRRATLLKWLRKIHLYIGLWGAILGLLFGITGILQNHRAILKIPLEKGVQTSTQLTLPTGGFATAPEMADWLQGVLKFTPAQKPMIRIQPAKQVIWADLDVRQPERWAINLGSPQHSIAAEYFVGNHFVKVEQNDATVLGTLMRLHTASGVNAFWVLLSDTIAGSLILLALTGLLMWTQLHTMRTVAMLTSVGALLAGLWFMWSI
jgi:hypothetical protein